MSDDAKVSEVPTSSGPRVRSPEAPVRSLPDCFDDVKKAYDVYSHANFSRQELASTLQVSATSGPFGGRIYALKEFGLLDVAGDQFKVSDAFKTLLGNPKDGSLFKQTALAAARRPKVFNELLSESANRLLPKESIASRLELSKGFVKERAVAVASAFDASVRFAGVVDSSNNILPIRETAAPSSNPPPQASGDTNQHETQRAEQQFVSRKDPDALTLEVALGDARKVVVHYPPDLSEAEAVKVGKVLSAITS